MAYLASLASTDTYHSGAAIWATVKGNKAGNYVFGRVLGRGEFGSVKMCTDITTGTTYAVKVVDKQQVRRVGMEEQFAREMNALRSFRHDCIVRLIDILQSDQHYFIVQEFINGGDLVDKLSAGDAPTLSEDVARRYFQQLVSAVAYLHSNGVCHRDIKLENVMLDERDNVKLLDFGFVNTSTEGSYLTTVCGSLDYTAPEVILGSGYDGRAADVWSLGCLLFVMLTGQLPFRGNTPDATIKKLAAGTVSLPSSVPEELQKFIRSMLSVDPKERITVQQVMEHPWVKESWSKNLWNDSGDGQRKALVEEHDSTRIRTVTEETQAMNVFELLSELTSDTINSLAMENFLGTTTQHIVCSGMPESVGERFFDALKMCLGNPETTKVDKTEVSGFVSIASGVIVYRADISYVVGTQPISLIALHRLRGTESEFVDFCALVKAKLTEVHLVKKPENTRDPEPEVGTFELMAMLNAMDMSNLRDIAVMKAIPQRDAYLLIDRPKGKCLFDATTDLLEFLKTHDRLMTTSSRCGDYEIIGHTGSQPLMTFTVSLHNVRGLDHKVLVRVRLGQGLYNGFKTFMEKLTEVLK